MIRSVFGKALHCGATLALFGTLLSLSTVGALAEPTGEQALYYWQDQIRTAGFQLGEARTGTVAQWPRMSTPAGAVTISLPAATGPIRVDGKLDEAAWEKATSFPVGPIFDDWHRGPLMLQVSACRDAKNVYLAVESPRDLTGLGALTPGGELFTVGHETYRVGPGGGLPEGSVARNGEGHVIELTWPLPAKGAVDLSFAVETVRRIAGKLPPELKSLGLDRLAESGANRDFRKPWLWLTPITVRLVPAQTAIRLSATLDHDGQPRLASEIFPPERPSKAAEVKLPSNTTASVRPYTWKAEAEGKTFSAEGFLYVDPVGSELAAARKIAARSTEAAWSDEIATLEADLKNTSPQDRTAWRKLYRAARELRARVHLAMLDAPMLMAKRHPYFAGHIYDDYITWHPGGGLFVIENPSARPADQKVRALVDPHSEATLGEGVYRDPELSWDARRVVFSFKGGADASTSICEVGIDGHGLRQLTFPAETPVQQNVRRIGQGHHDVTPAYLPDGRIVFSSTRPKALVPCFNSGVDTLHTMDADGGRIKSISANNVNEFDPAVMADGRILYGRWEYVDKTALYMQSLWTMLPDGRMEEALYGNNMARPTAILDARPVPGTQRVVASLTPHNGQAVGAIGMIDTNFGKNDLAAIDNFTPEYPIEMDQGLRTGPCDPWPLSQNDVLISNNSIGAHGIIELIDREGNRELVHAETDISCFAPMLVKPRKRPTVVSPRTDEQLAAGRFLLVDVYQGLEGVERGTVKRLRIVEETARTSGIPPGGRWWNQAFLVSWQGAYIIKNILGTVPVHEDGSAYFEVPAGRAVYFEALDAQGREIQRMRTFVQAVPGVTRSCIGCHENKKSSAAATTNPPIATLGPPAVPEGESWGSGYIDYPTMIQPILDKHCVSCHGGEKGFAAGLDFSGGWTWAFNISYETLIKHRLVGFLNCHNSSVHTSELLPPGTIGSGAAPLGQLLLTKYHQVPREEREVILAWMDTNSNYYGTWDYTPHATCDAIMGVRKPLVDVMRSGGCIECHAAGFIGADWVNLQTPEMSRILRAPMAQSKETLGAQLCRRRMAKNGYPLVNQSVQPPDVLKPSIEPEWDESGEVHVSFASTADPGYREMLAIIRNAQSEALTRPRVDMPGAQLVAGVCRLQVPMPVPGLSPSLRAEVQSDGAIELSWQRTADTIGLFYLLHRGPAAAFQPTPATLVGVTGAGRLLDLEAPVGRAHYALVVGSDTHASRPVWTSIDVPDPTLPKSPETVAARSLPGEVALSWLRPPLPGVRFNVYRKALAAKDFTLLNAEPLEQIGYLDRDVRPGENYVYTVRTLDRRGQLSPASEPVDATPLPEIREPVFATDFTRGARATLLGGRTVQGKLRAGAKVTELALELSPTGFLTFGHLPEFEIQKAISVECWVRINRESRMPVIAAAGAFGSTGWFLQRYGRGWRWHLAPVSCDGGTPVVGRWTYLVGTFDGRHARLYQDGKLVQTTPGTPDPTPWTRGLTIGQYSGQGPQYQVDGAVTGLKIYQRALKADEIAEKFAVGREN